MKALKYVGFVVISLLILILLINGDIKSIDLKFIKIEFAAAPLQRLCFPMWKTDEPATRDVTLSKATANDGPVLGDWHIEGSDGNGGTVLSYKFHVDGRISGVSVLSCSGCGGHFWLCPDARCGNRPTVASSPNGEWIAYAATDGAPATSTTYHVSYVRTKGKCLW
jgi:hypothetical protein